MSDEYEARVARAKLHDMEWSEREIERLRAELAAARKFAGMQGSENEELHEELDKARAELASLRKEHEAMKSGFEVASEILGDDIAKLREALEPFANEKTYDWERDVDTRSVMVCDLRRARAVLEKVKK